MSVGRFYGVYSEHGGNEHLDEDGTEEVVSNPCLCRGMKGGGGGRPQGRRKAECDDGRGGGGEV